MSENQPKSIPQIAKTLVDHLPEDINNELKNLLAAKSDPDIDDKIIELFATHEATRGWLDEQITIVDSRRDRSGPLTSYSSLAGNPSVPMRHRWVCPENPNEHWVMVIREGETPPLCKLHGARMIRGE